MIRTVDREAEAMAVEVAKTDPAMFVSVE